MSIYFIKPKFQRAIKPIKEMCIKYHISPDLLNVAAVVVVVLIGYLLFTSRTHPLSLIIIPLLVFIRLTFNALDGMVARDTGVTSAIGEVHNEVLDRVSDIIIILALGWSGQCNAMLTAIASSTMLLSSYIGIVSKAVGGPRIYKGIMCKPDRMIIIGLMALVGVWIHTSVVWNTGLLIILVGTVITCIQRYTIIRQEA